MRTSTSVTASPRPKGSQVPSNVRFNMPVAAEPTAATVSRPPSSSGSASVSHVLRALQQENDTLRSQLLQSQESTHQLSRQLEDALATLREASEAQKDGPLRATVSALQARCQTLAERLLSVVQGRQSSHSAEVLFLLRAQQEERLFLTESLEDILSELRGCSREAVHAEVMDASQLAQADALNQTTGTGRDSEGTVGLHAGTVYRLMTLVADEMRQQRAQLKLDAVRARMSLEHVEDVLVDVQEAAERATRSVFQSWSTLTTHAELIAQADVVGDVEGDATVMTSFSQHHPGKGGRTSWGSSRLSTSSAMRPPPRSLPLSGGASRLHTQLPYRHTRNMPTPTVGRHPLDRVHRDAGGYRVGVEDATEDEEDLAGEEGSAYDGGDAAGDPTTEASLLNDTTVMSAAMLFPLLEEELAWASDVLKACYRGLGDARQCTTEACAALETMVESTAMSPTGEQPSTTRSRRAVRPSAGSVASLSGVSEEVARLLQSFLEDLQTLARKSAHQQEGLARRLSTEMQQQYFAARQHEERVQALESENAKLMASWNRLQTELETRATATIVGARAHREGDVARSAVTTDSPPHIVTPERAPAAATTRTEAPAVGEAPQTRAFPMRTSIVAGLALNKSVGAGVGGPQANPTEHVYAQSTGKRKRAPPTAADLAGPTHRALEYDDHEEALAHGSEHPRRRAIPPHTPPHALQRSSAAAPHTSVPPHSYADSSSLDAYSPAEEDSDADVRLSESTADLWVQPSPKATQRRPATSSTAHKKNNYTTDVTGADAPRSARHNGSMPLRRRDGSPPREDSVERTSPYRSERAAPPPRRFAPAQSSTMRVATGARQTAALSSPPSPSLTAARPARGARPLSPSARTTARNAAAFASSTTAPRSPVSPVIAEVPDVPPRSAAVDKLWKSLQSRSRPTSPTAVRSISATTRISPSGLVSPRRERVTSPRHEPETEGRAPDTSRSWRSVRESLMSSPSRD